MKKITIGARGSKLSLAYVEKVKRLILETSKDLYDRGFYIPSGLSLSYEEQEYVASSLLDYVS